MQENASCWFIFQNDHLLLFKNDNSFLNDTFMSTLRPHFLRDFTLGHFNNRPCYCAEIDKKLVVHEPIHLVPLRQALSLLNKEWFGLVVKAYSVINWDKNHQFCSCCGQKTVHQPNSFERVCSVCKLTFYPRISPSIIVLIKKEDHLLMARSPHFAPGVFGLVAGFIESGESIEEAVHREVMEEVGIKIKKLTYFGSQPWPFPDSLMIGFTAEYAAGEIKIDPHEIEEAGWYRYDNLPGYPSTSISIAHRLIEEFIAEKT